MSGYDKNLLKDAPELTREERQEGYDPALAAPAPERISSPPLPSTTPHPPASAPSFPIADAGEAAALTGSSGGAGKEYSSLSQDEEAHPGRTTPAPVSFWRTTRGKLVLALLALLIVGAIVGGAVGGTVGHNKSSNVSTGGSGSNTSSVTPPQSQSVGSAGSGSGTSNVGGASVTGTASPTSTNSGGVGGDTTTTSSTTTATNGSATASGGGGGGGHGSGLGEQGIAFGVAARRSSQPRAAGAGAWAPDV